VSGRTGKIGPVLATVLVAGNMIGSGIFLLPATLAGIGSISLLGWIAATVAALLLALALARLAAVDPQAGGPCAYARVALGRYFGFQSYVLYVIVCWVGNLGVAIAAVGYLGSLIPGVAVGWPGTLTSVALIVALTALNIYGPRRVCQFDSVTMVAGLLPVGLVATLGWWRFDPDLFRQSWNPGGLSLAAALPQSLLLVFWAFLGLESASIAAAVVERPERNIALATVGGVLLAAWVYIAASAAIFGLLPAAALARSSAPFADATRVLLGPTAASLVAIAALIKTVGTLSGWILVGAQTGQAAAEQGYLPRALARIDRRGVPVVALITASAFTCAVALASKSPTLADQFERLVDLSVLLSMLVYAYAMVALLRPGLRASAAPGTWYRLCAALGILFCAYVVFSSPGNLLWMLGALLLLTLAAYALWIDVPATPATGTPIGGSGP
jgi:arginine:agmatine antiporter